MNVSDFDYDLPESAIAQHPISPRDASRLMVLNRETQSISHRIFRDLPQYLSPGDVLVLNDTKVLPARLIGKKDPTGGHVELLLLNRLDLSSWECLARPARRLKEGSCMRFGDGRLRAEIVACEEEGKRVVRFFWEQGTFEEVLHQLGKLPLPPYIKEELHDNDRYQTVYASVEGAKAAPTAGLHFTPGLLESIAQSGVMIRFVTLHVGLGTFRPVSVESVQDHTMHAEYYRIPEETASAVAEAKRSGGRVIAVGTTVARTLESAADASGAITGGEGWTDLFIYPGYTFKVIDAIVTNFHLPRSSLLMMISAFAGRETVLRAYREALEHGYRFFSFGDAMLIL